MPELRITLSARICPEMREYERGSTACANAYVQPVMEGYLRRLESSLRQIGVGGRQRGLAFTLAGTPESSHERILIRAVRRQP